MASPGAPGPLGDYAENWAALLDLFISVSICDGALAVATGLGVLDAGRGQLTLANNIAHACYPQHSIGHQKIRMHLILRLVALPERWSETAVAHGGHGADEVRARAGALLHKP